LENKENQRLVGLTPDLMQNERPLRAKHFYSQ
jgi:hypothetical protein